MEIRAPALEVLRYIIAEILDVIGKVIGPPEEALFNLVVYTPSKNIEDAAKSFDKIPLASRS